jgi:hypothetical protein
MEETVMSRKLSLSAVAAACFLITAQAMAGGPPMLCIPIDGVTPGNAELCAKRLDTALGTRVWRYAGRPELQVRQSGTQWYAVFHLDQDVALSEIEAALKGSVFSVPRDRLRLFGHVRLVIEGRQLPEGLTTDLAALEHVRFGESKPEQGSVLATVDMPYPVLSDELSRESLAWEKFQWTDFSSNPAPGHNAGSPATRESLPTIDDLAQVVVRHNAQLKDVRWSATWGCRPLGGVVVPSPEAERSTLVSGK